MPTTTRLRQIALAGKEIDAATASLTSELGLDVAHRDPWVAAFGLQNVILPIGDRDFLEVVSPITEDTSAGRYLDRNGGDGGYMLIFETPDIGALRPELEAPEQTESKDVGLDGRRDQRRRRHQPAGREPPSRGSRARWVGKSPKGAGLTESSAATAGSRLYFRCAEKF